MFYLSKQCSIYQNHKSDWKNILNNFFKLNSFYRMLMLYKYPCYINGKS